MAKQKPPTSQPPMPGTPYDVPPEGSLGLLALGAVGLRAWRAKRQEAGKVPPPAEPAKGKGKK